GPPLQGIAGQPSFYLTRWNGAREVDHLLGKATRHCACVRRIIRGRYACAANLLLFVVDAS
ncbi:MAG TPA: hypothetical protein P5211_10130, partial [Anaerolineae bacterium]|nr:hypothetical protein [Anaerolineae bacterium]